ncbi:CRISPR-associated helicase Cas3', partial [Candidatus Poribacteria bacterium]|nr:CRISPR-associated helicase Cas3' [Candidatus Poribacteria bacterium]
MLTLLAKSIPKEETLLEHTENCLAVYNSLRERMPFLAEVAQVPDFFEHLFYAVALHDFGKAATGFQKQLTERKRWGYRHEILSTGFVVTLQLSQEAKQAIALAILTHHKDIETLREKHPCWEENEYGYQEWRKHIAELKPNWHALMEIQEQVPRWCYTTECLWTPVTSTDQLISGYREFLAPYLNNFEDGVLTSLHGTYGMLMRGCMIACDHLASAGKNEIQTALDNLEAELTQHVKEKAEEKGRQFHGWEPFQKYSGDTTGQLMLSAPTGSGKTEAALLWSNKNQCETLGNRVFYVLPYTASINAMYNRLQEFVSDEKIGVLHGKAAYFVYQQLVDKAYTPKDAATSAQRELNLTRKICRPYKVLTPFQLLKAFFGIRGFEMQMAEMSQGLFIFDEIHAYDPHTTALILTMIKKLREDYDAKFCIMTATMPKFLKQMINDALGQLAQIEMAPEERDKKFTRHRALVLAGNIHEAIPKIEDRLNQGERVMVVCNTVNQAQEVFQELQSGTDNAKLLHSRFILRDRERIEQELENADLLVGTQAVEVSLDIDFDCLFTEPAPIDALVQRFGRINRKGKKDICDVHVCKEGGENDKYIYSPEKVERTIKAFTSVDILHESKIQDFIDKVYWDGYNENEQTKFENAKRMFERHVEDIVPFIEDKSGRDEFENLFKSIPVVPITYKDIYSEHIEAKEYY